MKNKTTLTDKLSGLADKTANTLKPEKTSSFDKKRKNKILKTIAAEQKLLKTGVLTEKPPVKNPDSINTQINEDESLRLVQARKLQMMTGREQASSPLQMHLVQSESLKVAQQKISDLEEEILSIRKKNEALASAGEIVKENNKSFKAKIEDLKSSWNEEKEKFKEEKKILLSAVDEARDQVISLKNKNQNLEKRISNNFYGIRQREHSLEGRIEILKMENSALQKEKDKKILDLKKDILKLKSKLETSYRKNHESGLLIEKLKDSARRAVSALRATIYNLEGVKMSEETIASQSEKFDKAG